MSPNNEPRLSKAERTAQAREQARIIRDAQLKKQKRNGWLIKGGVLVAAVAIVVIIALVVINTQKANTPVADSGPVPTNMNTYGGITLGKDGAVIAPTTTEKTVDINNLPAAPTAAAEKVIDPEAIGIKATGTGEPVQMVIYFDFMCPFCNQFETSYGAQLKALANEEKITVEYRALGFLDRFSGGTNYSSRAGAAAACVAETTPNKYQAFLDTLFANQPAENSKGLDNAKLKQYATEVGAADISSCVDEKTFRPYVANTTGLASAHGVSATPTVFMDGEQWVSTEKFEDFSARILAAKK
ncbi:disulfide bond formation protein DsbA [Arthrobacter alpinus]|uniref:DsbA family protein n=1 Tax=Arthrobacter alpinus TaxID=656366 RepID=UPI0005CB2288|nr:thioredoxin domain-containing protein [Arthrobacter alpinus]ALV44150.1 disulfide bond formation protein DsbA [Arthrobacter alpinus]